MRIIIGITGASGVMYGISLLKGLRKCGVRTGLIISEHAKEVIKHETELSMKDIRKMADEFYGNDDLTAPIASGSQSFDALVIAPCSMTTLSKIAVGIGDNLITRAASICLKEKRKLILVPRETPLSAIHLENMHKLALAGATILPAMPAFYHKPKSLDEMVDFIVGRIMENLGIENDLYKKWKSK